jgi:hypothetical protein
METQSFADELKKQSRDRKKYNYKVNYNHLVGGLKNVAC